MTTKVETARDKDELQSKEQPSRNQKEKSRPKKDLIVAPHVHDVLCGRDKMANRHGGNEHFRTLVRMHKIVYALAPKKQKPVYAKNIVDAVRSLDPPGRFLKQDSTTTLWYGIGDKKALAKTRQALREGAPTLARRFSSANSSVEGPRTEKAKGETSKMEGSAND